MGGPKCIEEVEYYGIITRVDWPKLAKSCTITMAGGVIEIFIMVGRE